MKIQVLTDDAAIYDTIGVERNCLVIPAEIQIKLHTVKDHHATSFKSRQPDKHVVTLAVIKRHGRRVDKIMLRTFFSNEYSEAHKQYRELIRQFM